MKGRMLGVGAAKKSVLDLKFELQIFNLTIIFWLCDFESLAAFEGSDFSLWTHWKFFES